MQNKNQNRFLKNIKSKMLHKSTIIDSAIYEINSIFFDLIFSEGGDDELAKYDSNRFAYQMTIRLTESDIKLYDNDNDLELYNIKKQEVLSLIKSGKLTLI